LGRRVRAPCSRRWPVLPARALRPPPVLCPPAVPAAGTRSGDGPSSWLRCPAGPEGVWSAVVGGVVGPSDGPLLRVNAPPPSESLGCAPGPRGPPDWRPVPRPRTLSFCRVPEFWFKSGGKRAMGPPCPVRVEPQCGAIPVQNLCRPAALTRPKRASQSGMPVRARGLLCRLGCAPSQVLSQVRARQPAAGPRPRSVVRPLPSP
jgi:hypothetical protein